jgi:hypothetical protein
VWSEDNLYAYVVVSCADNSLHQGVDLHIDILRLFLKRWSGVSLSAYSFSLSLLKIIYKKNQWNKPLLVPLASLPTCLHPAVGTTGLTFYLSGSCCWYHWPYFLLVCILLLVPLALLSSCLDPAVGTTGPQFLQVCRVTTAVSYPNTVYLTVSFWYQEGSVLVQQVQGD